MPVSAFFFLGNGTGQSGWGGPTLKKQKIEQVVDRFALSSCVVVSVSPPKGVRDHPLPPRKKDEKKPPKVGLFPFVFFFFFLPMPRTGARERQKPRTSWISFSSLPCLAGTECGLGHFAQSGHWAVDTSCSNAARDSKTGPVCSLAPPTFSGGRGIGDNSRQPAECFNHICYALDIHSTLVDHLLVHTYTFAAKPFLSLLPFIVLARK